MSGDLLPRFFQLLADAHNASDELDMSDDGGEIVGGLMKESRTRLVKFVAGNSDELLMELQKPTRHYTTVTVFEGPFGECSHHPVYFGEFLRALYEKIPNDYRDTAYFETEVRHGSAHFFVTYDREGA